MSKLSHIDKDGAARMVDISRKKETHRKAVAQGVIYMAPETLALLEDGGLPKGDVLPVARLAGIMAAKKTADLIPLCHPLSLQNAEVTFRFLPEKNGIEITATATLFGRTGIEMEALTAVSLSALTIYDMCKAVDKTMRIGDIRLIHKSGGKSGTFDAK
ncbi:cyclic pyranopterin monophosphate synthase MoaC [Luteithermobacter gelatinilyticus]|uniref:cyclic pyranopterin monophosphate synthase MoaC n=1 Tax=Luteithermobacter gelatinilyticus TaxID=2582913 RepID=UPI00110660E6|nr:cyclic pyranopterin monophosphate synthase MoaC [Luteithermobacter gelatinilyticus]